MKSGELTPQMYQQLPAWSAQTPIIVKQAPEAHIEFISQKKWENSIDTWVRLDIWNCQPDQISQYNLFSDLNRRKNKRKQEHKSDLAIRIFPAPLGLKSQSSRSQWLEDFHNTFFQSLNVSIHTNAFINSGSRDIFWFNFAEHMFMKKAGIHPVT